MSTFELDHSETFTLENDGDNSYMEMQYDNYEDDDFDDDDNSASSASYSLVTKKKKEKEKKKVVDKGYRKFKTKDGNIIYFATSMLPGTPIRDAIYGHRFFEYQVGTPNEELFFKVCNASNNSSQNVDVLFYDNPEQFESHMNCHVDIDSKNRWAEKYQHALQRNNRLQEYKEQKRQEFTVVK